MKTKRFHNIVDLENCNDKIKTPEDVQRFILELVKRINMSILSGPHVAEGIPENPGVSAFAIVDFSHVSIHTFTATGDALIDIFSCKPYERETVLAFCKEYFATDKTIAREKEVWWGE